MNNCCVCEIVLTTKNICGNGFYPPDCNSCYKLMCNNCYIVAQYKDPDSAYCKKCILKKDIKEQYTCTICKKFGSIDYIDITDENGKAYCINCSSE